MKLRQKILIFVISMIVIPMSLLGGFGYYLTKVSAESQAKANIENQLQQQAQAIKNHFDDNISSLTLLSKSDILEHYIRIQDPQDRYTVALGSLLNLFADFSAAFSDFYEIRLIQANGIEDARFTSSFIINTTENESNSTWLKKAIASGKEQYLTLDTNFDNKRTALYAIQKIYHITPSGLTKKDKLWGYLVITIEPKVIENIVTESNHGTNLIINTEGMVFFNNPTETILLHTLPHFLMKKLKASAVDNSLVELSYNKQGKLFQAKALPFNYYVVSGTLKKVLYENSRHLSYATMLMSFLMILIATLLTFSMINRYLLNPISKLSQASKDVAEGNLSIRLKPKKSDEIGSLFLSFNKMVSSILTSKMSLEHYKNHLEDKVESRTLALKKANEDLIEATENAKQANQLKSRFLANMSHEIRTPLTAIIGFTEQALKNTIDEDTKKSSMQRVMKNSQHLLELINDILDLSKIEAGKLAIESIPTSIYEVLTDIGTDAENKATEKGLSLTIDYQYPIPNTFNTDPTRLRQILLNLISNAIKFTDSGKVAIRVSYQVNLKQLQIDIIDTGIGISESQQQDLFNPFVQADISTTRNYGGTGLGLAITKHLADSLNYEIQVSSKQYKGSCFTLILKKLTKVTELLQQQPIYKQINNNETLIDVDLSGKHILVAEDNPDNQVLITLLLRQIGIEPVIVENGLLAVEQALADDFDLILMDMQMPKMSGIEATEMLRQAGFDEPIIALTANYMKADIEKYKQIGCNASLAKPIETHRLYHTIIQALSPDNNINEQLTKLEESVVNSDAYQVMQSQFKLNLPDYLQDLEHEINARNWQKIESIAHQLKGSGASMGYPELTLIANELEQYSKQHSFDKIKSQMTKLQQLI